MIKLFKALAGLALVAVSALLLSGCAAGDTAATPAESAPATSQSQTSAPSADPNSDKPAGNGDVTGSVMTEAQIVEALKGLDFKCEVPQLKAVDIVGSQIEFSTISCRRGQEPVVVFNLAGDANELELITIESCKVADGTVLKNPITAGANWQVLSAANDRPLLEVLGKTLGGTVTSIDKLCTY